MSAACFWAEPWASVEMYLSPAASTTALIAASSVFQRSSWKVFQETAIVLPLASTGPETDSANTAPNRAVVIFFIYSSRKFSTTLAGAGPI